MKKGNAGTCTAALKEYCPTLEADLRRCMDAMEHNEQVFQYEIEPDLVDANVYEHAALECRYAYLIKKARALGLRGSV